MKIVDTKFQETPSAERRVDSWGQTDRQTDRHDETDAFFFASMLNPPQKVYHVISNTVVQIICIIYFPDDISKAIPITVFNIQKFFLYNKYIVIIGNISLHAAIKSIQRRFHLRNSQCRHICFTNGFMPLTHLFSEVDRGGIMAR